MNWCVSLLRLDKCWESLITYVWALLATSPAENRLRYTCWLKKKDLCNFYILCSGTLIASMLTSIPNVNDRIHTRVTRYTTGYLAKLQKFILRVDSSHPLAPNTTLLRKEKSCFDFQKLEKKGNSTFYYKIVKYLSHIFHLFSTFPPLLPLLVVPM